MNILNYISAVLVSNNIIHFADGDITEEIVNYGNEIIGKVVTAIGGVFLGLSILVLIVCGLKWVSANSVGNLESLSKAKKAFFGTLGAILICSVILGVGIGMMGS